jgi:hypothetical protein
MLWKEISVADGRTEDGSTEGKRSGVKGVMCRRVVSDAVVVICGIEKIPCIFDELEQILEISRKGHLIGSCKATVSEMNTIETESIT